MRMEHAWCRHASPAELKRSSVPVKPLVFSVCSINLADLTPTEEHLTPTEELRAECCGDDTRELLLEALDDFDGNRENVSREPTAPTSTALSTSTAAATSRIGSRTPFFRGTTCTKGGGDRRSDSPGNARGVSFFTISSEGGAAVLGLTKDETPLAPFQPSTASCARNHVSTGEAPLQTALPM
mmetsp:Transcript_39763/g.94253  ORF Transcript_39763/g.94253 Transcript_39763/m.94253 type:complete len:183 (+) Transcript_39763:495-1043(+)